MHEDNEFKYVDEFGSVSPVRFLDTSKVRISDSDGEEVMCRCGKPATYSLCAENSFLPRCTKCMWGKKK